MTMDHNSIDPRLREALRATSDAEQQSGASPTVADRLLAAVRAERAREQRRQQVWLAIAAALVMAVGVAQWLASSRSTVPLPEETTATATNTSEPVPADFLPLPYATVPTRGGQIVQIAVPASALVSFGLQPVDATTDAVNAEVFVGEDGLARAVRFNALSTKELAP